MALIHLEALFTYVIRWIAKAWSYGSLSREINHNKSRHNVASINCSAILPEKSTIEIPKVAIIRIFAFCFTWGWTVWLLSHCDNGGPHILWLRSMLWKRGELFEKQARAKIRKGVVGSRGKMIPRTAKKILSHPMLIKKYCLKLLPTVNNENLLGPRHILTGDGINFNSFTIFNIFRYLYFNTGG